jgi:hypothetical protein
MAPALDARLAAKRPQMFEGFYEHLLSEIHRVLAVAHKSIADDLF